MKNLIYILFVVLMLVLAFIIMNSGQHKNTIYSDYSINLNEGVNYSNLESYGHTKNSSSFSNNYSSSGLIPSTLNNTSALNSSSYGNTDNFSNSGKSSGGQSGFKSTTNDIATINNASGGYNISSTKKNDEQSSGEGISGSLQIPFSSKRKTGSGNQKNSNGLIASSSIGSNTGFISAPADPYGDYNEDDITHPGGNPMGQPIPVGSGTLPLLLFVSSYLLYLYIKKNRNIL